MSQISVNDPRHAMNQKQVLGHPIGLFVLFFVEMWERFSYYGMRALLTLYLAAPLFGIEGAPGPGLGWTQNETLAFYGWYTMLVYISTIPGGIIADKFIGQKKSVLIGGILLCIGHSILAVNAEWAFLLGLGLIILGVGGLKANISTMVGGLYKPGDDRRDKGFYIFYIGINVGAFLGAIATGWASVTYGWHYGFGLAGIGMFFGQIMFFMGQKYLIGVGEKPDKKTEAKDSASFGELIINLFKTPLPLAITVLLAAFGSVLSYSYASGIETHAYAALSIFLALTAGILMMIHQDINTVEKDRFVVLLLSFLIVIVFWGAFEQAGGLMNLYAEHKTDRYIAFIDKTVPAAWFQSVNSAFIIMFGALTAGFWFMWKQSGKESSSIFKMAIGVIVMGLGFIFMVGASRQFEVDGSSAMYWLVLAYLLHTLGELCTSPVALSFITKVAPVKYVSVMMGVYFAATGLGNKVAGVVGQYSENLGELEMFISITVFCVIFGFLVIALLKPLKRLTHGAEEVKMEN
jgi:proton-dependent oligopeptide transporter, POT family